MASKALAGTLVECFNQDMPLKSHGIRKRLLAAVMAKGGPRYERLVEERKRTLFAHAAGRVLEVGAGTGPNLRFLTRVGEYRAAEPNPFMLPHLRAELERYAIRGTVDPRPAEALLAEAADASFDTVVCTLVLCSVKNPRGMLAAMRRVLRPGGKLLILEHLGAERGTMLCGCQYVLSPLFGCLGDGCRPTRRTAEMVAEAGFSQVALEHFQLPLGPIRPHVCGWAEK